MERVAFFHLHLHAGRIEEYLALIGEAVTSRHRRLRMAGVNPYIFMLARKDHALAAAINRSELVNVDGMALSWGMRLFGHPVPEKVACPDVLDRLLAMADSRGWRVYFLGATAASLQQLVARVRSGFPGIVIAGSHHGYFPRSEETSLAQEIAASGADLLFLGMPSPKKETFIDRHWGKINVPFCLGVGGMFDVLAGKTRRAAPFMRRLRLEWFCRFWQEPGKMLPRDIKSIAFVFWVLKERMKTALMQDRC